MNEPRLLPKNPNSVTPSAARLAIRDLASSLIREMSSGRIIGSPCVKTVMLVWYATYQLAHLDIRHAVTKAHWHNPAMCELPEDWRSGLGGDEVDDGREALRMWLMGESEEDIESRYAVASPGYPNLTLGDLGGRDAAVEPRGDARVPEVVYAAR